jgi:hypothetical protein
MSFASAYGMWLMTGKSGCVDAFISGFTASTIHFLVHAILWRDAIGTLERPRGLGMSLVCDLHFSVLECVLMCVLFCP